MSQPDSAPDQTQKQNSPGTENTAAAIGAEPIGSSSEEGEEKSFTPPPPKQTGPRPGSKASSRRRSQDLMSDVSSLEEFGDDIDNIEDGEALAAESGMVLESIFISTFHSTSNATNLMDLEGSDLVNTIS